MSNGSRQPLPAGERNAFGFRVELAGGRYEHWNLRLRRAALSAPCSLVYAVSFL